MMYQDDSVFISCLFLSLYCCLNLPLSWFLKASENAKKLKSSKLKKDDAITIPAVKISMPLAKKCKVTSTQNW